METQSLFDIVPHSGSVFMDNTCLSSADRLLSGNYETLRDDPALTEADGTLRDAAATAIVHDSVNLAILLESLLCFEHIYVNADFINRWNPEIGPGTLSSLSDVVTGVQLEGPFRWEGESAVIRSDFWRNAPDLTKADVGGLVATMTHNHWERDLSLRQQLELLTPYEPSRPFPGGTMLVGAGFYVACSQALGVPYRPSALRGLLLERVLRQEIRSWRNTVAELAFGALGDARQGALQGFMADLTNLNLVEMQMPVVLSSILSKVREPEEVIPAVMRLRNIPEAVAFREWCGEFAKTIQENDTRQISREYKALKTCLARVNRRLGLQDAKSSEISVGWGPVAVSKTFSMPRFLDFPISIKRHAWFLQKIYETVLETGRFSTQFDNVFFPRLPEWMQQSLGQYPLDWRQFGHRVGGL